MRVELSWELPEHSGRGSEGRVGAEQASRVGAATVCG